MPRTEKSKPIRILVIGAYGVDNWGDEAILSSILTDLRKEYPFAEIRILSGNPSRTTELHGVESAHLFPIARGFLRFNQLRETIKFICWSDIVVLGGGGLFQDYDSRAIPLWSMQCFATSFCPLRPRKPLFIWGVSVGPLRRWTSRLLTRFAFSVAKKATVRDKKSAELLSEIGVDQGKVKVTADPVILFPDRQVPRRNKKRVVFALRPSHYMDPSFPIIISQFVGYINNTHGYNVEFIAMQSHGQNADPRFNMQIAHNFPVHILDTLDDVVSRVSRAHLVVGMRLHSLIIAATQNTPFIALSYAPKVRNFCEEIGADKVTIPVEDITFDRLCHLFRQITKTPPKLRTEEIRSRARQNIVLFGEFIDENLE